MKRIKPAQLDQLENIARRLSKFIDKKHAGTDYPQLETAYSLIMDVVRDAERDQ